jgi:hypothetical protein
MTTAIGEAMTTAMTARKLEQFGGEEVAHGFAAAD